MTRPTPLMTGRVSGSHFWICVYKGQVVCAQTNSHYTPVQYPCTLLVQERGGENVVNVNSEGLALQDIEEACECQANELVLTLISGNPSWIVTIRIADLLWDTRMW